MKTPLAALLVGVSMMAFTVPAAAAPPSPELAGVTAVLDSASPSTFAAAASSVRAKGSQSPATVLAIIVVLVVLGAGGLAVLRGRLEPPGSGSAPPSR